METSKTCPMPMMPPAPALINSSSVFYRDSTSPVQTLEPVYRDYYPDCSGGDDKSTLSSEMDRHVSSCRSSRIEFAIFLKVLFKLLEHEKLVQSRAKDLIAASLRTTRETNTAESNHRSMLLSLEDVEQPLRSLVGESVWVCAYHYTKLYQQRHHRSSRIFGSNMTFKREWSNLQAPSATARSSYVSSTVSLSSASETVQEPQNHHTFEYLDDFPSTVSCSDQTDDDDTVEILDELSPNQSLISTTEVEAEFYNFLRDAL